MKVKKKHLEGGIAHFPKHVVQLMVDEQVNQGNTANPLVFADTPDANQLLGGFLWENTDLGYDTWRKVIKCEQFHLIPKPEKPKGHVHAKLMKKYAKDAKTSETPWELWEFRDYDDESWRSLGAHPYWGEKVQYRRKPKSKVQPTPNEIIQAMLDKGMVVWVGGSDISYKDARDRSCRCIQRVIGYDDSMDYPVRTESTGWTYAIPIDLKTMTEITELPK